MDHKQSIYLQRENERSDQTRPRPIFSHMTNPFICTAACGWKKYAINSDVGQYSKLHTNLNSFHSFTNTIDIM